MDPNVIEAIASLLWPVLILVILLLFSGTIRNLLKSGRKFSVKVAGNELTFEEATEQQRILLSDIQTQIANLETRVERLSTQSETDEKAMEVPVEKEPTVRSILWVDDNPRNNSYIVAHLEDLGIDVTISLSTNDALAKLEHRKYDRIISDMGRPEGNKAGINLTKRIRADDKEIPIIIFCGGRAARNLREDALKAGANEITSSTTQLLRALDLKRDW